MNDNLKKDLLSQFFIAQSRNLIHSVEERSDYLLVYLYYTSDSKIDTLAKNLCKFLTEEYKVRTKFIKNHAYEIAAGGRYHSSSHLNQNELKVNKLYIYF
jgi:predicted transcriptional regulator